MNVDSGRSMNKVFYIMEHIFSAVFDERSGDFSIF